MKVNGPNNINLNPYQKQINKLTNVNKSTGASDKVEISSKAQELLKGNPIEEARSKKIEQLKSEVQSGDYKINYELTAKKMIDFWAK